VQQLVIAPFWLPHWIWWQFCYWTWYWTKDASDI